MQKVDERLDGMIAAAADTGLRLDDIVAAVGRADEPVYRATMEAMGPAPISGALSIEALFEVWRGFEHLKACPGMTDAETARFYGFRDKIEEEAFARPVETVADLWKLVAMVLCPEDQLSGLGETFARRARIEAGLPD